MAALSTRELPVTIMNSGVAQAPGAVCVVPSCAYDEAALAAMRTSANETIFRMTQIYTVGFGGGPRQREYLIRQKGRRRVSSSGPLPSQSGAELTPLACRSEPGTPASRQQVPDRLRSRHPS